MDGFIRNDIQEKKNYIDDISMHVQLRTESENNTTIHSNNDRPYC